MYIYADIDFYIFQSFFLWFDNNFIKLSPSQNPLNFKGHKILLL